MAYAHTDTDNETGLADWLALALTTPLPDEFGHVRGTADRIQEAAFELFLEFGFRRATMEDVARRARVSRITLYRHYGNKNVLLQAVIVRELQLVLRHVDQQVRTIEPVEERAVESLVQVISAMRRHPLTRRLLDTEKEWVLPQITLDAGPGIVAARVFMASFLRQQKMQSLLGSGVDVELVSELLLRLIQSCLLTPGGLLASEDDGAFRQVMHSIFLPVITGTRQRRMIAEEAVTEEETEAACA